MAVLWVNYKDMRKTSAGLIYARAIHPTTVGLSDIAEQIEHNCSMTKGDVLNVLNELITVMKSELNNSNKVCLDGFGTFYISVHTSGAASEKLFDITDNLKGIKCNFLAQGHRSNGVTTRTFTDDVTLKKFDSTTGTKG